MYIIHILEWTAHPSEMESITITPKHKSIKIKSVKELLDHLGFRSVNSRSWLHSIPYHDWKQKSALVYFQVFSQMDIKWLKWLFFF